MLIATSILALLGVLGLIGSGLALRKMRRMDTGMFRDSLTGCGNRRAYEEAAHRLSAGEMVSVAMIDFDRFGLINEAHGRKAGDMLLCRLATTLVEVASCTYGDRIEVFRLAGDEFVMIMAGIDNDHAAAVVERARQEISSSLQAHERTLTMSCGLASMPDHADSVEELLSYADRALYQAKRAGRDRTVTYARGMFDKDAVRDSRATLQVLADALAAAVDAKDAYTHAHSRNVSDLSLYLAREMGLDEEQVADIALGALLHDIGKIGVSDSVLRKPGRLSQDEWEEIKTHCEIGNAILSGIEGAEHIREMVLYHHERPDGTGYPYGLCRDDIPVAARIIGVADAFDSMTAERVYSKPRSASEAMAEIVRLRGRQFDTEVVEALCRLMMHDADDRPDESEGLAAA
jgi:diguanylate cyclase (GGDEF)-like protein/putative nucleotidyltransferase with HDIG domain